jgi:hypothetical protein
MYDLIVGCMAVMAMPFWTCYRRLRSSPLVSGSGFSVGIPLRSPSEPTSVLTRYFPSPTYLRYPNSDMLGSETRWLTGSRFSVISLKWVRIRSESKLLC